MSCFNCYSSRKLDSDLVDRILEQGQRLRGAMVQSILNNDPFNTDVYKHQSLSCKKSVKLDELNDETNDKIKAFLRGDAMSTEDEILTLETLRSMSPRDLCRATDRTYRSDEPCDCLTCFEYKEKDLNCDLKRNSVSNLSNEITQKIQEKNKSDVLNYLKFVDSVKISVNSVVLNEAGNKKVMDSLIKDKVANVGQTYFLEYQIPSVLMKNQQKSKSKVDSGLDLKNIVRICSRGSHQQAIIFKQTSIHDVNHLHKLSLSDIVVEFRLSFRNFKQKHPVSLGSAKLLFNSFEVTKNFVCNQELALKLNDNTPIIVGSLRLSVQLGCGRLYFGKEFIDAISSNKENAVTLDSDDLSSNSDFIAEEILENYSQNIARKLETINKKKEFIQKPQHPSQKNEIKSKPEPMKIRRNELISRQPLEIKIKPEPMKLKRNELNLVRELEPKCVLFGFVYVSEAQFSREVLNSYLTCQLFVQDDTASSKLVAFDSNPIYNFCQQIPLVYDESLLLKLRENFMVVEFFEKGESKEFLIGLTKLGLHQFYLTYRNPLIVKHLSEKKLPVISTDGWEPIFNPVDDEVVGQAQILIALGTKEQIENLENERGFKKNIVKAKTYPPVHLKSNNQLFNSNKTKQFDPKKDKSVDINVKKVEPERDNTVDVGVQSIMESKESQDIEKLLTQIVQQKQHNVHVENSTNTDPINSNRELKSTSDLLDSLQKALSVETPEENNFFRELSVESPKEKGFFKAHVVINSALHLPSRRKCKSKKSKGRNGKHEDILPSVYVTFEAYKGELKITPIVPKSTNPKWDFRCDVNLSTEYLTNNQKCLVFKVWRKSTNTTMMPNMQTDVVIGLATVDLTVLLAGLPSVQGWYNINDLSNKCNGQINIHVTPLENIAKHQAEKETDCCSRTDSPPQTSEISDEPSELLGRALKRKFTELDEITQRLRLRLSKVTNDESDTSNDEIADEFERDINTLCVEDDFDMIDFEKEARSFNLNHIKEIGLLQTDGNLIEGKQKIDCLLEKLSLFSSENSSRYVSGCSEGRLDTEAILNELDSNSRPNIYSSTSFNKDMAQKFGNSLTNDSSMFSESRAAPEGQGNLVDTIKQSDI